jgi:hypothetical protein
MANKYVEENLVCTECAGTFIGKKKINLLGFPEAKCALCGKKSEYQLEPDMHRNYVLLISFLGLIFFFILLSGRIAFPGILMILVGYALYKNRKIFDKELAARQKALENRKGEVEQEELYKIDNP